MANARAGQQHWRCLALRACLEWPMEHGCFAQKASHGRQVVVCACMLEGSYGSLLNTYVFCGNQYTGMVLARGAMLSQNARVSVWTRHRALPGQRTVKIIAIPR